MLSWERYRKFIYNENEKICLKLIFMGNYIVIVRDKGAEMMNLAVNILQNDVGYTVQLNGEIDAYTASDLKDKVMPIASEKEVHIVVDFTEVEYMDSTGLGVFIALLKASKKNDGKLEFIGVSKRLKRLFDITGLTEILNLNADFEKVERR